MPVATDFNQRLQAASAIWSALFEDKRYMADLLSRAKAAGKSPIEQLNDEVVGILNDLDTGVNP